MGWLTILTTLIPALMSLLGGSTFKDIWAWLMKLLGRGGKLSTSDVAWIHSAINGKGHSAALGVDGVPLVTTADGSAFALDPTALFAFIKAVVDMLPQLMNLFALLAAIFKPSNNPPPVKP